VAVSLNILILAPLAGAVLNCMVVAVGNVKAVVSTASRLAFMSDALRYGNVNEYVVVDPLPV
jgi:hypothetical protein